ncbi:hypothetical protein DERF_000700 [Dermatophagoides farinae]|uniref:Protein kinase domain-containing protein n=2 Tax=Dermatophagoides farinae TaxID=6954 RepID=A0A922LCL4_DERFA|nr:hypothetical protein DERF_000700 [Dermatophagoides farinae]
MSKDVEHSNKTRAIESETTRLRYFRTNNRDIKISKLDPKQGIQQEIDQALEYRKSNQLRNDHQRELLDKGYRLRNIIGSGSYAHVFRAKDLRQSCDVAIKLIELDKCSRHYKDVCLRNEIYVIRELSHENIVHFYEAFNTSLAYIMVMELVDAGTFADLLKKNGPISDDRARRLFKGVFFGVDYMHQKFIAHRDLKLENILINKYGQPKISDFSLSVIWDGRRLVTDWCGTPPYFSPEILQGIPYNPLAYDIWSLGVCLFIMTNDTLPFMFVDYQEMLQKQLNRDWKFRTRYERNISDDLKQLIRAMLDPDNNNRIKITDLIQTRWFRGGGGAVIDTRQQICY